MFWLIAFTLCAHVYPTPLIHLLFLSGVARLLVVQIRTNGLHAYYDHRYAYPIAIAYVAPMVVFRFMFIIFIGYLFIRQLYALCINLATDHIPIQNADGVEVPESKLEIVRGFMLLLIVLGSALIVKGLIASKVCDTFE